MVPLETKIISPSLGKKCESHHSRFYHNEPEVKFSNFLLWKGRRLFSELWSYFRVASYKMKMKLHAKERKDVWVSPSAFSEDWGSSQTQQALRMVENLLSGALILSNIWPQWGAETAALILDTILDKKILGVWNLRVRMLTLKYHPVRIPFTQ